MRRLIVIILMCCVILSVKCLKEWNTEIYENSDNVYQEYEDEDLLFDENYDDSMFFRKIDPMDEARGMDVNNSDVVLNCFGIGGRFSTMLNSYLRKDANGTKALKVLFYSTSRKQPKRVPMRHGDLFLLDKTDFDITRRTIFIVHGFFSDGNEQWIFDMEKALLKWGDVNVFVVDWSDGANTWNYFKAAINTKTVGNQLATFIGQLINQIEQWNGPDPSEWGPLHLIGHSLGAHICGHASYELKRRESKWPIQRITGLDPAQPCFRHSDLALRLDLSDAEFVDVIHTNGRILKKLGLGLPYPLGHVDFYPNGGNVQPGCILAKSSIWKYLPLPVEKIKKTICSHGRSHLYLTESIITAVEKNCTFWAHEWDMSYMGVEKILSSKCEDKRADRRRCTEMGINAEKYSYNGTFFAITGSSAPYCSVDTHAMEELKKFMEKLKKKFLFEVK